MMYEIYDKLDGRVIRVFPHKRAFRSWSYRFGRSWFSLGYGWRRRYSRIQAAIAIVGLSILGWIACIGLVYAVHDVTARVLELVP